MAGLEYERKSGKGRTESHMYNCPYCEKQSLNPLQQHMVKCRLRKKYESFSTYELEMVSKAIQIQVDSGTDYLDRGIYRRIVGDMNVDIKRRKEEMEL